MNFGPAKFSPFRALQERRRTCCLACITTLVSLAILPVRTGTAAESEGENGDAAPVVLEPVVAVATRENRPLREVAGTVTVVTREDLDRTLTTSLDDVFRYTPGIDTTTTGTRFGTEGVIIRGIGGNRVAMELDGVPLSQQFAVGNFSNATRDLVDTGLIGNIITKQSRGDGIIHIFYCF